MSPNCSTIRASPQSPLQLAQPSPSHLPPCPHLTPSRLGISRASPRSQDSRGFQGWQGPPCTHCFAYWTMALEMGWERIRPRAYSPIALPWNEVRGSLNPPKLNVKCCSWVLGTYIAFTNSQKRSLISERSLWLPFTSCENLGKRHSLSVPLSPHL